MGIKLHFYTPLTQMVLWHEWMEKLHEFAFVFFKNWQLKNLILLMESSNISYLLSYVLRFNAYRVTYNFILSLQLLITILTSI